MASNARGAIITSGIRHRESGKDCGRASRPFALHVFTRSHQAKCIVPTGETAIEVSIALDGFAIA